MLLEGCATPPAHPVRFLNRQAGLPGGSFCAWDGRLDGGGGSGESPAAAALDVYRRRGAAGFRELIGDWSLALWDQEAQTLVLASDYAGIRPLYYRYSGGQVRWSSALGELAAASGIGPLDEAFAAEFLFQAASRSTPYPGIAAVPPGCAVMVSAAGLRVQRFWDFPAECPSTAGDTESELRLFHFFREAVEVRIRPYPHAASELSGGLDSSSVVAMATELGSRLTTFSYTHPNSTDERYFRAVERHCGVDGVHLRMDDYPIVTPDQTGGASPAWWEPRMRGLARHLKAAGAETLLTGQLGDLTMGNVLDDSDQAAAYLRRFQFGRAAREAYEWSQSLHIPIYPILWRSLRLAASSWTPEDNSDFSPVGLRRMTREDSLSRRFRRRAREIQRENALHDPDWRSAPPDRRRRWRVLAELLRTRRLETPEPLLEFSYSHPFAHRPLVEFMLTVPRDLVCRPGEPRRLMRRALRGILPEPVLTRRSKADYTGAYSQVLRPLALDLLHGNRAIRLVELGLLEPSSLRSRLDRFTQGLECDEAQLRQILLLEFWLRGR